VFVAFEAEFLGLLLGLDILVVHSGKNFDVHSEEEDGWLDVLVLEPAEVLQVVCSV